MISNSICHSLSYFIKYITLQVHLCCCKWQIFHCFLCLSSISLFTYIPYLLYPFISWWTLSFFHILAIVNNAPVNIVVHFFFQINVFVFFGYISRSRIGRLYGSSIFGFGGNLHVVFLSGCINLQPTNIEQVFPFLQIFARSFMFSGLSFRSLIHFEFIFFKYSVGECYANNFTCPAFFAPFIEETVFSPLWILASFVID